MSDVSALWHSPHRVLLSAIGVAVVSVVVLLLSYIYVSVRELSSPPPYPVIYPSPQQIVNAKPFYRVGDTFITLATRCNRTDKPVRQTSQSFWESQDHPGLSIPSGTSSLAGRDIPPGCTASEFPHTIPSSVTPGSWRFGGFACIPEERCTYWYGDTFLVVP